MQSILDLFCEDDTKKTADKATANWSLDWKPQREFQVYQLTNVWWKKKKKRIADVTKEPVKISEHRVQLV